MTTQLCQWLEHYKAEGEGWRQNSCQRWAGTMNWMAQPWTEGIPKQLTSWSVSLHNKVQQVHCWRPSEWMACPVHSHYCSLQQQQNLSKKTQNKRIRKKMFRANGGWGWGVFKVCEWLYILKSKTTKLVTMVTDSYDKNKIHFNAYGGRQHCWFHQNDFPQHICFLFRKPKS